jgi:meso-butanediol dehydrogenase / (S,S)-butanediol dehydrogenase / diacetyl reductase
MATQFNNKIVIVTGASSGIGEAIAIMFASRGAKVTICGRDHERLKSVFDKVVEVSGGHKDRFLTVQGDLNDGLIRKEIITKTIQKFGGLNILVPNAGVTASKQSLATATEEVYDYIMNTNVKSVFFLIQEATPHLEKSKGNIVFVSSVIAQVLAASTFLYSLSKSATNHITKSVAVELGPKGIRANSVNPCFIPTMIMRYHGKTTDVVNTNIANFEVKQQVLPNISLSLKDITDAVAFLASDETARFITGMHLLIEGGRQFGGPHDWSSPRSKL